ncbi:MAG: ABC transporter substrate-binding protein, partial [bacterium]
MRLLLPFLLLVAALVATIALDRPLPPADLVVIERSDCYTLDPQRMSYQHELRRARVIYETLVNLRASDCAIVPGVAERWESSNDGHTWTFHLRENARWSNGDLVTSRDFVYAWRRAMLPDTAADYSALFFEIKGAKAFFDRRAERVRAYAAARAAGAANSGDLERLWADTVTDFETNVGIETPDDRTLVVHLQTPLAYFLDLCAFPAFAPVHRATVERFVSHDPDTGSIVQRHGWTKPGEIVTNGAYTPTVWRYKRDMRLERNPHYWNPDGVQANSIECRTIENPNTGVLAFESGGADWLTDLGPEYKTEMLAERQAYLERFRADVDAGLARGGDVDDVVGALPPPGEGERRDVRGFNAFGTDFFSFNCR